MLLNRDTELDVVKYADEIALLVAGSILVQSESDELRTLASAADISRAVELTLPVIGIGLVQNARA